jgi:(2Fe-2S) ferredoxin
MSLYSKHILVCLNQRPPGHPRGSCGEHRAMDVLARFQMLVAERLPGERVRANGSTCLGVCELGPVVVVYPEGIWYKGVRPEDVEEIFEKHIVGGEPVERLRIRESDLGQGS